MLKKTLYLFVFCICFLAKAQNTTLFSSATTEYNNGNYSKAIANYLKIIDSGEHSAALYFNLGNSYYKENQIAPSIYYFEKALLLKPNDKEIINNLSYANNMTIDAFDTLPETVFSRLYKNIIATFTFDQWSYMAIAFVCLFVILYIAFKYVTYSTKKRIALILSFVCLLMAIITLLFAVLQFKDFNTSQPAIVYVNEVTIKSEPNTSSQDAFTLHVGTKVNILEHLKDWRKIVLIDGQTGWVKIEDIKPLKDF